MGASFKERPFLSLIKNFRANRTRKDRFLMRYIFCKIFKASSESKTSPDRRTTSPGVAVWRSSLCGLKPTVRDSTIKISYSNINNKFINYAYKLI